MPSWAVKVIHHHPKQPPTSLKKETNAASLLTPGDEVSLHQLWSHLPAFHIICLLLLALIMLAVFKINTLIIICSFSVIAPVFNLYKFCLYTLACWITDIFISFLIFYP